MTGMIRFTPNEEDYVAAQRLHFVGQVQAPKFRNRMGILTIGTAAVMTIAIALIDGNWLLALVTGIVGALAGAMALGVCVGGNFLLLPRRSRRLFRQQRSIHRETAFAWDADGSRWTSDRGDTRTDWCDHHRWREGQSTILLYLNDNFMQFLPKRAFADSQIEDLRTTLTVAGVLTK
ncbi:hypothetical protein DBR17_00675 [Sphingomonas sp. HMWF008]|nr:hypothetical protein DBR17_00675 [Sphingomonas sp. HMWF008]